MLKVKQIDSCSTVFGISVSKAKREYEIFINENKNILILFINTNSIKESGIFYYSILITYKDIKNDDKC